MITWQILQLGMTADDLGLLPDMLHDNDPRPAREQFNERYQHGGGWRPMDGWKLLPNKSLKYPGDPAYLPVAKAQLRSETIYVYPSAWVVIVQPDMSFEVARMD